MPFFAHASGFTIKDGHIYEIGGDVNIHFAMPAESIVPIATQLLGKRKERDLDKGDAEADGPRKRLREAHDETSDGLMIVHPKDIDLHRQLTSGSNYRTHSAFYGGRVVAVKVFDGPHAKQSWKLNLTLTKNFFHSNVPKIVGISDENISETPFIVFHGIPDRKMNSLLARALRTDLNKSVQLSMKTVKGLAAGLSYMESWNLLSKEMVSNLKWENFDIFAGGSDEPVLSIHLLDTTARGPHPAPSFYHPQDYRGGTEILSGLCQKLFSEVNSILYDDSPERELDADDFVENYSSSRVVQTNREGHSNVAGDVSSSTEVGTSHKTPRREVRWKLDKSANNRSLESIVRRFEDYLDCVSASSADSPLRRITASPHKWVSHRCPGYLREEIALTADVSRSVVIAHQYPSQSEICTICGQLVQYPSNPVCHPFSAQSWATWQPGSARSRSTTTVVSATTSSSNVLSMQPISFLDSHSLSQSSSTTDNHHSQSPLDFSIPILSNGDGRVDRMIPQQEDFCFTQNIGVALQPLPTMPDDYSQSYPTRAISASPPRVVSLMTPLPESADFTQTNAGDSAVTHMAHPEGPHLPPVQRLKIATQAVKTASKRRRKSAVTFMCDWPGCVDTFTTKHNLRNHLISHLGIRNYQCDVCKRTFGVAHVLTRHRKKCHAADSN